MRSKRPIKPPPTYKYKIMPNAIVCDLADPVQREGYETGKCKDGSFSDNPYEQGSDKYYRFNRGVQAACEIIELKRQNASGLPPATNNQTGLNE